MSVVDLKLTRCKREDQPVVRMVIELYRTRDGRVAYDAWVEERTSDEEPALPVSWIVAHLRWAILTYSRSWRMGLRRRRRPHSSRHPP